MVQFVDPRASVGVTINPYDLGIDLASSQQPTVAFLANGFPDSVRFLAAVRDALQVLVPGLVARDFDKGNASITVGDDMLADIKGADAAIAAYGHWGSCTTGTVRDGIAIAKLGIPAVSLVTEDFWPQGDFTARSAGMPDIPRVKLPHPVAGTGVANLQRVAALVAPNILAALRGWAGELPGRA